MHLIKCVIWDLDNTIWDGILSEISEVRLKQDVREILIKLNQKGIVNSICSRNDYHVAIAKLKEFGIDHLFIYPQISWSAKSVGVRKIMNGLHLRPNNILFVDDTAFERDEVQQCFPNIETKDAVNLLDLLSIESLKEKSSSSEAQNRILMYKMEESRLLDSECFEGSNQEFLLNIQLQIKISMAVEQDLERIEELIDRTNQLNSTGIRYEKEQICKMVNDSSFQVYVADVWDKYGAYGRTGLVIAKVGNECYEILQLIVSCRLMGKGIAQALLAYATQHAKQIFHCKIIRFLFKRTEFNRQMLLLYTINGFSKSGQRDDVDIYELFLAQSKIEWPKWVTLQGECE